MRSLISALAAAGLVMFGLSGYPAEESTVKSKPDPNKRGHTIEESAVKSKPDPDKPGRTIEESTVKSKPDPNKPGRTIKESNAKSKSKSANNQPAKAPAPSEQASPTAEKK
jgi:hypothetical protein